MSSIKKALVPLLVFCLLLAQSLTPSLATVLFMGGEDIDFSFINFTFVDTNSSRFRSSYAREAISTNNGGGSTTDPPLARFYTPTFTATQSLWFHGVYWGVSNGTDSGTQVVCAITADGVCRLVVRGTGAGGSIKISTRTSGGAFVDLVTCTLGGFPVSNTVVKFDWQLNYSTTGSTNIYVNGVSICPFTGDVTASSGQTQINQYSMSSAVNGGPANDWSEMIVSTTDTRDMNLWTCYPAANGVNMTWTGSFSNVNPTTINDASSIFTGSSNQTAEFTCPSLPTGSFTVPMVKQSVRTVIGATGPQNFRYIARPASAGADFDNGSDIPGNTVYTNTYNYWAVNPQTSGPWATSDLGSGVNFGVKSRP